MQERATEPLRHVCAAVEPGAARLRRSLAPEVLKVERPEGYRGALSVTAPKASMAAFLVARRADAEPCSGRGRPVEVCHPGTWETSKHVELVYQGSLCNARALDGGGPAWQCGVREGTIVLSCDGWDGQHSSC